MAIIENGIKKYEGQVLYTWDRYWMDGMISEYATIWNTENHMTENIQVGYYGSDCSNLMGAIRVEVDASEETIKDILKTLKKEAQSAFVKSVTSFKQEIRKGTKAKVIRGRKVKKGTVLDIFWVGERETYKSRQYSFMYETENVAGGYDENGNKVWIKTDYLKSLDTFKSPNAKERKLFIKEYVSKRRKDYRI